MEGSKGQERVESTPWTVVPGVRFSFWSVWKNEDGDTCEVD